jgi:large subunit ribosomal protein L7Ae
MQRLKVPPTINQFTNTLEKNQTAKLLKLLAKYKPETHKEKALRLKAEAEAGDK